MITDAQIPGLEPCRAAPSVINYSAGCAVGLVSARSMSVGKHLDETRGAQWLVYSIDTPWVLVIAPRDFFS